MAWNLSCPDWADRLRTGRSLVPDLPLDLVAGERAVAVFNKLKLSDVIGTPTTKEAVGDWYRDIVRATFGSVDAQTGVRGIRELFVLVPKKQGKTTNSALLMVAALLLNQRPNASLIMTAPTHGIANLAFDAAAGAIALDPVLDKKLYVRHHLKKIVHRETGAELEIMSFDPKQLTGQKPVAVLIDELHVVSSMSQAHSAIRQLRGGMIPFPEAFMMFITTQSENAPAGVFSAELTKAREIRDGKREGVMLPLLYEMPEEIQRSKELAWKDPKNWGMVNPSMGRQISIERLFEEMQTAEQTSEMELRGWASQHLNVQIGVALHANGWAGAPFWEVQARKEVSLETLIEECEVIDVGIDGGGLDDFLGLAAVGRHKVTRQWWLWTHAWVHTSVLALRKSEAQTFSDFSDDGDLTISEIVGTDIEELADIVAQIEASKKLDKVGVDPSGLGGVLDALTCANIPKEKVIGIKQGWTMVGAVKTMERKLADGTLIHGGQRMMNWCTGNAKVVLQGNAVVITKQASGTAKIDPLLASINAVTLMSLNPEAPKSPSFQLFSIR